MKIVKANAFIESTITQKEAMDIIERAGRTCYKSENKIAEGSAEDFIRNIIKRGHETVIEHVSITARVICDRGVTHEIVRHRLASYSQESTRYCNYSSDKFGNEITVIKPCFWEETDPKYVTWMSAMQVAGRAYFDLLNAGATPQEARSVLPNSLKTEIVMTMNFREWRHFFKLRCSSAAHPQMREVANILLNEFKEKYPLFVEDLEIK